MLISEVIQAPKGAALVYYHGTHLTERARRIAVEGLVPGDATGQTNRHGHASFSDKLVPVTGMVYLTPIIGYAAVYALHRKRPGHDFPSQFIGTDGRYGYIFVVPADSLSLVQPDEDETGEAAREAAEVVAGTAGAFSRMENFAFGTAIRADAGFCRDLDAFARKALGKKGYAVLSDRFSTLPDLAVAGKKLLPKMPEGLKARMIALGCHIAHQGPVMPTEVWRLDKTRNPEIGFNAEHFFEVAERLPLDQIWSSERTWKEEFRPRP